MDAFSHDYTFGQSATGARCIVALICYVFSSCLRNNYGG